MNSEPLEEVYFQSYATETSSLMEAALATVKALEKNKVDVEDRLSEEDFNIRLAGIYGHLNDAFNTEEYPGVAVRKADFTKLASFYSETAAVNCTQVDFNKISSSNGRVVLWLQKGENSSSHRVIEIDAEVRVILDSDHVEDSAIKQALETYEMEGEKVQSDSVSYLAQPKEVEDSKASLPHQVGYLLTLIRSAKGKYSLSFLKLRVTGLKPRPKGDCNSGLLKHAAPDPDPSVFILAVTKSKVFISVRYEGASDFKVYAVALAPGEVKTGDVGQFENIPVDDLTQNLMRTSWNMENNQIVVVDKGKDIKDQDGNLAANLYTVDSSTLKAQLRMTIKCVRKSCYRTFSRGLVWHLFENSVKTSYSFTFVTLIGDCKPLTATIDFTCENSYWPFQFFMDGDQLCIFREGSENCFVRLQL